MRKTAVLIIDMQVGASELTDPVFYRLDIIVERLKDVIKRAREKKVPIYYVQHHSPNGFPVYGTHEWQIIPDILPQMDDIIIHKSTPDVFLNTPLHEKLQINKIERLVIGGIQSADCIDTSCRRAFSLGYQVILIKNGHTTFDSPVLKAEQIIAHHNHIIENWFGEVLEAENINF